MAILGDAAECENRQMSPIVGVRRPLSTGRRDAERILSAAGASKHCPAGVRDWFAGRPDLTIVSEGHRPPPRASHDARELADGQQKRAGVYH